MSKISDWWNRMFHSKRIVLLGPKGSGKTQFLCSLGAVDKFGDKLKPGEESNGESYNSLELSIGGKKIFINRGHDDKGASFQNRYRDALRHADIVFYVFDLEKYLSNVDIVTDDGTSVSYRNWVHSHLERIKLNTPQKYLCKLSILMTHADLCPQKDKNALFDEFRRCAGVEYSCFSNVIMPLDATQEGQCIKVFKKYVI